MQAHLAVKDVKGRGLNIKGFVISFKYCCDKSIVAKVIPFEPEGGGGIHSGREQ